jgi:lactosylceramide 4-alpha-galactosyltransferase
MRFQAGHPILEEFVRELSSSFDGSDWGANGPKLVTRVLQQFCRIEDLGKMNPENCLGINVFPPEAFYPVPWRQWKSYFNENDSEKVLDQLFKENSYIAHVWGKHSSSSPFKGTNNAYSLLAQKHCPLTYFEN